MTKFSRECKSPSVSETLYRSQVHLRYKIKRALLSLNKHLFETELKQHTRWGGKERRGWNRGAQTWPPQGSRRVGSRGSPAPRSSPGWELQRLLLDRRPAHQQILERKKKNKK